MTAIDAAGQGDVPLASEAARDEGPAQPTNRTQFDVGAPEDCEHDYELDAERGCLYCPKCDWPPKHPHEVKHRMGFRSEVWGHWCMDCHRWV